MSFLSHWPPNPVGSSNGLGSGGGADGLGFQSERAAQGKQLPRGEEENEFLNYKWFSKLMLILIRVKAEGSSSLLHVLCNSVRSEAMLEFLSENKELPSSAGQPRAWWLPRAFLPVTGECSSSCLLSDCLKNLPKQLLTQGCNRAFSWGKGLLPSIRSLICVMK